MSDLNELFKVLSAGKKQFEETDPKGKIIKKVKQHVKEDLNSMFAELSALKEDLVAIHDNIILEETKQEEMIVKDLLIEIPSIEIIPKETPIVEANPVDKYFRDASFQQPDPDLVSKNVDEIRAKIKFLEQAIGKIAATGPGSGEVNLRWLDDVDRPTIYDMRFLRYNDSKKKFEFAEVNPHDVVYTTFLVTTPTYNVNSDDYYIGVNYAGPTTITLPTTLLSSGRTVIIKDESGNAETNPITVVGNVDNDPNGFIIQINNGAVQLIYRNGWRIV